MAGFSSPFPLTLGAAVAGLLFAGAILIGIYQNRRTIITQLKKAGEALFSQVGFFTIVIVVFMVISVLESGQFFNVNITHEALFGTLGYALALGFDLVSVVCMLARMGALRMRDERGARLNLLGVIMCAAVSAFANAAASLQGYNVTNLNHTPWWMQQIAPWLGTVFPTMIVVLSLTTDHLLDHRGPSKSINLDTYRAQEQRRVDMLHIKLDTERELLTLDKELSRLRVQRGQARGHLLREWFFVRWMRPVIPLTQEVVNEQIDQAVDTLRLMLDAQIEQVVNTLRQDLDIQIGQLQMLVATVDTHLNQMETCLNQLTEQTVQHEEMLDILRKQLSSLSTQTTIVTPHLDSQVNTIPTQVGSLLEASTRQADMTGFQSCALDNQVDILAEQVDTPRGQVFNERQRRSRQTITLDTFYKKKNGMQRVGDIEERILSAQQTLGPGASNRQIARLINCSPTTVARYLSHRERTRQKQELA